MTPSDPHGRGRNNSTHETNFAAWLPVIAAMAIMVTGCLSTFLVLQLDEFRPRLGDIVAFKPGSQDTDLWQMTIPATIAPAPGAAAETCTLDANVIAEHGGSLVVEGVQETPVLQYTIHWSGLRTADNSGNCGASADLTLSRTDLQRLANAAGGFGVGNKGITD
jgi:hypothetical protein